MKFIYKNIPTKKLLNSYNPGGLATLNIRHACNPLLKIISRVLSMRQSHIDSYLDVEQGKSAILGPFSAPPIVPILISPIMTRPKKDSLVRRLVVDLSWPRGLSINDGIPSNEYLGRSIDLTLPTVDYMAERVQSLGRGCFMYKLDLSLSLSWLSPTEIRPARLASYVYQA